MAYEIKYRSDNEFEKDNYFEIRPLNWKVIKVGTLFHLGRGRVISKEEIEDNKGEYPVYSSQTSNNGILGYISTYDYEGDYITWTTDGANAGTVFLRKGKFNCTNVCGTLKPIRVINLSFAKYILSTVTKRYVRIDINPKLMNNEMNEIRILFPSLDEQQKIANFLDIKIAEFDTIISKKEQLIEKLEEAKKSFISEVVTGKVKIVEGQLVDRKPEEMKDSGVEWLGMIPRDWDVKKLKHITIKIGSGKTPRGGSDIYVDKGIAFLRSQNIYNEGLKLEDVVYIDENTNKEMLNSIVKKGDILLNITGASIGRSCLYNIDTQANVNQHVCIIRLNPKIKYKKYIELIIQSNLVQNYINSCQTGASREGLNFKQIGNIVFSISNDENEIFELIRITKTELYNIHSIITKTQEQITKLKEAKQSLISEAVTGKIDLRDWEIIETGGR